MTASFEEIMAPELASEALVRTLRPYVPDIAKEAVAEIRREIPDYAQADEHLVNVLERVTAAAIDLFLETIVNPEVSRPEVEEFFFRAGYVEAQEGRGLDRLQSALRLATRVGVRFTSQFINNIPTHVYGEITGAIFPFLDSLVTAAARGHEQAVHQNAWGTREYRRQLLDLLVGGQATSDGELQRLAGLAEWRLPQTAAVVALRGHDADPAHPNLPPDVLLGLHLEQPCLVVPDPEGPGRRHMLEQALRGWDAAIGPSVGVRDLAGQLDLARQALDLAAQGVLPGGKPIIVTEHMPTLVIMQAKQLVGQVAMRRLKPLQRVRPAQRRPLAETLLAYLECGFNATTAAHRLHLHPQTIRYRLRKLEELFGPAMHDPEHFLEFQMVLHGWLLAAES